MKLKEYIKNNIMLDMENRKDVVDTYQGIKEKLEERLSKIDGFIKVVRQGSVSTNTAIKPKEGPDKFDLDIVVLFDYDAPHDNISRANEIKSIVHSIIGGKIKAKCTTSSINTNLEVDVVPMFAATDGEYIYDTEKGIEIHSNNLSIKDDFNKLAAWSADKNDNALRESIMLMKKTIRDNGLSGIVPSVAINCIAASVMHQSQQEYISEMVNIINQTAETILTRQHSIHNPIGGDSIEFNGDVSGIYSTLIELAQSILEKDNHKFSKITQITAAIFATGAAVGSTVSLGSVSGSPSNYAE